MIITEDNILEIIPQRPPMVMIGCLVSSDERTCISQLLIKKDNLFVNNNKFTASGMMEAMAQTAAARTGYLMRNQPGREDIRPPVGVIGSIKNFRLFFQPEAGSIITTTIEIEHEVLQATVVKAKVEVDGKIAAECNMQIFLNENESS
jgi:3-hydroxymyristoyl/3-hydroxydecanoyl-(acyl carrier protein) dehydratase